MLTLSLQARLALEKNSCAKIFVVKCKKAAAPLFISFYEDANLTL
jgi:hypothetical protein